MGAIEDRRLLTGVLVVVLMGVLAVVAGRVDAASSLPPLPDRLQLVLAVLP